MGSSFGQVCGGVDFRRGLVSYCGIYDTCGLSNSVKGCVNPS